MTVTAVDAMLDRKQRKSDPPRFGIAITPSDTDELVNICTALYVGVSGDIKVTYAGDTVGVILKSVPIGYLPGLFRKVFATGTTATNLVAVR